VALLPQHLFAVRTVCCWGVMPYVDTTCAAAVLAMLLLRGAMLVCCVLCCAVLCCAVLCSDTCAMLAALLCCSADVVLWCGS